MVQSYGVVADHEPPNVEIPETQGSSVTSPLLGDSNGKHGHNTVHEGHAGISGSISNLANTILGTGMLTFPLSMASSGILPGILTCIFSGSVAAFGLYLLSLTATRAPHRRASFFAVAQLTFPKAAVFFDAAIATKCFGVSISYLIIIKGLMPKVVAALYHDLFPGDPPDWTASGRLWITLFMIILVPLSFLRSLNSLRHTSYVAIFAVVYLVIIVIVCYFHPLEGTIAPGPVYMVHFTPDFVSTFPVQVFAFTCSQNIFPIYNELVSNTQRRMNLIVGSAIGFATVTYEIVAVFGYLTFGSNVGANIVAMYPTTSLFVAVGQLAIVILVLFSYPLQVHPCRNCLDKVFSTNPTPAYKAIAVTRNENDADDGDHIDDVEDEHGKSEMTTWKHTVLTSAVVAGGFVIAYLVDDLKMVLSFVGSTGSTTISFILPGLFFWKLFRDDPHTSKALTGSALALAFYGAFIFVFCLSYNIYRVVRGAPPV